MAVFAKDFLYGGEWHLPGGRVEHFTPERVAHLGKRMGEMQAAGIPIPVALEHQPDATPMSRDQLAKCLEEKTRGTIGWANSANVEGGNIFGEVEIPDADDAKALPKNRFVSPQIERDITDGTGRFWPGESIVHLAVTPRPVQHTQQPWKLVKMSATGGSDPIRLSLEDFKGKQMADKKDEKPPEKPEVPEPEAAAAEPEPETTPEPEMPSNEPVVEPDPDIGLARLQRTISFMRSDGYAFPDDTNPDNFVERLETAAMTKQHALGNTQEPSAQQPQPNQQQPPAGGANMGQQIEQPPMLAMSRTVQTLQQENAGLKAIALSNGREKLKTRIENVFKSGRCDKSMQDIILRELGSVKLSLSANGNVDAGLVEARIATLEALPANLCWPADAKLRMSREKVGDLPAEIQGKDERAAELRAEARARAEKLTGKKIPA